MKAIRGKRPLTDREDIKPFLTWLNEAKDLERDNEFDLAITEYKKIIHAYPLKEEGYDRLMIILRKNKNIREELAVIKKAIKTFEEKFGKPAQHLKGTKVKQLSNAILKSMGLADKNGQPIYQHEPFARWIKRKKTLESKLKNFPAG
jgi:hypothetical protein